MQGHSAAKGTARMHTAMSAGPVPPGSHEASCSHLSDYGNDDNVAGDLETYDVGEYHLTSCPICLEHFTLDNPAILLKCEHGFHLQCLESWRQRSSMCPMCLTPVVGDEGRLMSSADARRRRRMRRRLPPPAAARTAPEHGSLMSQGGCGPQRAAPLCATEHASDADDEIAVIEVTARDENVGWLWRWLRECCAF